MLSMTIRPQRHATSPPVVTPYADVRRREEGLRSWIGAPTYAGREESMASAFHELARDGDALFSPDEGHSDCPIHPELT